MKKASLKDIAQRVNCSLITVSRALNGRADDPHVSPKLREEIRKAAAELHYVQHRSARTLRLGRSRSIGLLATSLCGHQHSCIIDALFKECLKRGYQFKIVLTTYNKEQESHALEELLAESIDGIICQPELDLDTPVVRHLAQEHFPMLLLGGPGKQNVFQSIVSDMESFWDDVFTALIARGHRKITVQGEISDEQIAFYSARYDIQIERVLQKDSRRSSLNGIYAQMSESNVKALVCLHTFDAQNYFYYQMDRGRPLPDCIGVYSIPGEFFRHEKYLGAVVSDMKRYVECCLDRMIFTLEHPGETPQKIVLDRKYLPIEQLKVYQEKQLDDPWFSLYST